MHGARFFFFLVVGGWRLLTLLAAVRVSAIAAVHTRRLHSACAAIPQDGQRQSDAPCAAHWLCPACATAAYALRIAFAFSLKRVKKQKVHHFSIYGA